MRAGIEVFTAVKIKVEFFCVVTQCRIVVGYQRFGGPCRLHLQGPNITLHGITTQNNSTLIFTAVKT